MAEEKMIDTWRGGKGNNKIITKMLIFKNRY
jgi:hypothetical protein